MWKICYAMGIKLSGMKQELKIGLEKVMSSFGSHHFLFLEHLTLVDSSDFWQCRQNIAKQHFADEG